MSRKARTGASLALLATIGMVAAPAAADHGRGHGRGEHRRGRDKHDDDRSVGGFVLGALLAGGLVAALAGKKKDAQPVPEDVAFVPVALNATSPAQADLESAVAACAASVEGEGRRAFPIAQVATVTSTEPVGPGFAVRGDVLLRASFRDTGERHPFRCAVDGDAVNGVTIDGLEPIALPAG